jgi:predicted permease
MFTVVTLVTISIAIGANTAVFSVINGVLLKPLPYPEPGRLASVWQNALALNLPKFELSASEYFIFREENRTFQNFGLWSGGSVTVTGLAEPEQVRSIYVTDGTLQALGIQPALGRVFAEKEYVPDPPDTVILTHSFWQRKFGGAASAIGQTLRVQGTPRQIVGVMPRDFRFLDRKFELIFPLDLDRSRTRLGGFNYQAIARMKPGVTLNALGDDIARMIPIVHERFPPPQGFSLKMFHEARIVPVVSSLKDEVVGDVGKVLWVLMGTITIVLLIACANVANLLLVRAEGRQQELSIRSALGANRKQITGELLFESLFLGILGGILGIGVAYAGLRLLVYVGPDSLPRLDEISIDPLVLLFAFAISIGSGLLFGLFPVLKYAGPHLATGLRGNTRSLTTSRERHYARNTLVVVQIALALVLLISSGLMIRTFQGLKNVQPGFSRPNEIQTLRISIPDAEVQEPERALQMQKDIVDKIAAMPGVTSVGLSNSVPTDGYGGGDPIFVEGQAYKEGEVPPIRRFKFVGPDYFRTIGTRLLAGRDISWTDLYERRPVAIVTENIAREVWRDPAAAIGKRVRQTTNAPWREVVGVVENIHDEGADKPAPAIVFWPMAMSDFWDSSIFVNRNSAIVFRSARAGSESLLKETRNAVWSVNANLPLSSINTLEDIYHASMARTSFSLVMLGIAGSMALFLGIVGIYGVMSYSVSQRTREIGIRMALGAHHGKLKGEFVRQGVVLAGIGAVFGLAGAAALTRLMASLLFAVKPVDPVTYVIVAAGLIAAAATATYVPARRATTVNPVEALRSE